MGSIAQRQREPAPFSEGPFGQEHPPLLSQKLLHASRGKQTPLNLGAKYDTIAVIGASERTIRAAAHKCDRNIVGRGIQHALWLDPWGNA